MRRKGLTPLDKIAILVVVILAAGVWGSYFGVRQVLGTSTTAQSVDNTHTIALLIPSKTQFFNDMIDGVKAALPKSGLNATLYDATTESSLQVQQIDDAISKRYAAILIAPVKAQDAQPELRKAMASGIPVFTVGRDVPDSLARVAYIGTDMHQAASTLATYAMDTMLDRSKTMSMAYHVVLLEGSSDVYNAVDIRSGFHSIFDPLSVNTTLGGEMSPRASIVADLPAGQVMMEPGSVLMMATFMHTMDIQSVLAASDTQALDAIQGIKDQNLQPGKDIFVFGIGLSQQSILAIDGGSLTSTIGETPYVMGYWGVQAAAKMVFQHQGPPVGLFPSNKISTPFYNVTTKNIDQVLLALRKAPANPPY